MFGALSLLNVAIYLATRFPLMVYADRIIGPGGALVSTIKRDTITSLAIHPRHDMPCFVTRDPKSGAEQYLSIQWHWFQDEPEALLKRLEKEFGPLQTGVEMKTPDA